MRMTKMILLVLTAGVLLLNPVFAEDTDVVLMNMLKSVQKNTNATTYADEKTDDSQSTSPDKSEDKVLKKMLNQIEQEDATKSVNPSTDSDKLSTMLSNEESQESADKPIFDEPTVEDILSIPEPENAVMEESEQLISVRLDKVPLEEAINLFAQLSGANIIVPELEETARVSVNLTDVEWKAALQSILDSYGYELYKKVSDSNVYTVRRRPEGAPEPQVVETFKLKYATVPNAAKLIRELLPPDAKVSEFASRNMLVVKSTESSISEIRKVLATIDQAREQVFIEAKFLELNEIAQKDLGIDWQVLQSFSAGTAGPVERSKKKTETDAKTRTTFTDINGLPYEDTKSYVDNGERVPGSGLHQLEGVTPTLQKNASDITEKVLTAVLSADEFRLVLSALSENKGVNIVSNPKVIVANEENATISIVRKEPNIRQERTESLNDQPDLITYELDPDQPYFEYGIKLDVTPSINTSSNIAVKIVPSLTRKYDDKQAGANTYPIIDEKSIVTVFNLSSGQTAAIGGLTEVEDSDIDRKIPLLGDIPYLGRLFSYKQTLHDQKETIIFVTVGLANVNKIERESGLPEDSELVRRQIIKNDRQKILREQGRKIYARREDEKLKEMLKIMRMEEKKRQERKRAKAQKKPEKTVLKQNNQKL